MGLERVVNFGNVILLLRASCLAQEWVKARVKFGVKETILFWKFHLSPWDEGWVIHDALPNVLQQSLFYSSATWWLATKPNHPKFEGRGGKCSKNLLHSPRVVWLTSVSMRISKFCIWFPGSPDFLSLSDTSLSFIYIKNSPIPCTHLWKEFGNRLGQRQVVFGLRLHITVHCKSRPTYLEDWYLWPEVIMLLS